MNKIKENLNYIINEGDDDKLKLKKIMSKFEESEIELVSKSVMINSVENSIVVSTMEFLFRNKEIEEKIVYPYVAEVSEFNKNLFENINNFKKHIIFEKLGIQATFESSKNSNSIQGTITQKQKELLNDKSKSESNNKIVNEKLKEFGLDSVDELRKDQASKIIDCLPRRG